MSQMLRSTGLMGLATLTSRMLGMVREIVYARFMGDGWVASAFVLAFTIPNLFRRLLGEGALTAAFIPIFKAKERTEGDAPMWRAACAVISGLVVSAAGIIVLAMLGVTAALTWLEVDLGTRLMLELLRLMFPYMLLVCLAAVCMGMLNARGYFFVPALGATVLNVVMIGAVFFLAPRFGDTLDRQIFALGLGVLAAGVAQVGFQLPALHREGFRYRWVSPWSDPTVRTVVQRMLPGTIGVAAFQINVLLTQGLAFCVDAAVVASFNYAVRLMELPQGVFGVSLATFLLPTLAGLAAEKNWAALRATLAQAMGYVVFANALASVLLVVLAEPIVRLLFERGEFSAGATSRAALALACLAPGLVAFSLVNVLARAFHAMGDTRTPMWISAACLVMNVVLAFWGVHLLRQGGLGLANSLSAAGNVWLLLRALRRKLRPFELSDLAASSKRLLAPTLVAGLTAWGAGRVWETLMGHGTLGARLGGVFVPALLAVLPYAALALWLRVPAAVETWEAAKAWFRGTSGSQAA